MQMRAALTTHRANAEQTNGTIIMGLSIPISHGVLVRTNVSFSDGQISAPARADCQINVKWESIPQQILSS